MSTRIARGQELGAQAEARGKSKGPVRSMLRLFPGSRATMIYVPAGSNLISERRLVFVRFADGLRAAAMSPDTRAFLLRGHCPRRRAIVPPTTAELFLFIIPQEISRTPRYAVHGTHHSTDTLPAQPQ